MWKKVIAGAMVSLCIGINGTEANIMNATKPSSKPLEVEMQKNTIHFAEEVVRKRLKQDQYEEGRMDYVVWKLSKIDAKLQDVLDAYLKDGTISDSFSICGLRVEEIMKITGNDFFDSLNEMNRCVKNPALAQYAKKYITSKHMKIHTDKVLVREVMEREHYSENFLEVAVDSLIQYDEVLQPIVDHYLKDGTIDNDFAVDGLTIGQIMKKEKCHFFSALKIMNDCVENPFLAIRYTECGGLLFEE